jgi:hypothetical protein
MRNKPMADDIAVLRAIYNCFNARDIDGVLDALTDDVARKCGLTALFTMRSLEMQDFACQAGGFAAPGLTRKYKKYRGVG